MYEPRTYRRTVAPEDLIAFEVVVAETDLQILAEKDLGVPALDLVREARTAIERWLISHPWFAESFAPVDVPESAHPIVRGMANAARSARVGPMAAVAGAVAEYVARGLVSSSPEIIVENGGDVYLIGSAPRTLSLWAGADGVNGVGVEVTPGTGLAVCTSSGRVGHSVSFGTADAVAVLARDGALADACATAFANRVHGVGDIVRVLEFAHSVQGVEGVVVSAEGELGAMGDMRIVPVRPLG